MAKKIELKSYTSAFLMSLAFHISVLFLVITFGKASSDAQKIVVIDLTLLDHVAADAGTPGHNSAEKAHGLQTKFLKGKPKEVKAVIEQERKEIKEEKKETREKIPADDNEILVQEQVPPVEAVYIEQEGEQVSVGRDHVLNERPGTFIAGTQGTGGGVPGAGDMPGTNAGKNPGGGYGNVDGLMKGYLRSHFSYIKEMIQKNIAYPDIARRNGWTGKVTVSFIIAYNGRVRDIEVVRRSGFDCLDSNAVKAVKRSSPFPRPPIEARIIIPILYELH